MGTWLTWSDLADRWRVSKRSAVRIAQSLGITPIMLAPHTPRFRVSEVAKAERQKGVTA